MTTEMRWWHENSNNKMFWQCNLLQNTHSLPSQALVEIAAQKIANTKHLSETTITVPSAGRSRPRNLGKPTSSSDTKEKTATTTTTTTKTKKSHSTPPLPLRGLIKTTSHMINGLQIISTQQGLWAKRTTQPYLQSKMQKFSPAFQTFPIGQASKSWASTLVMNANVNMNSCIHS